MAKEEHIEVKRRGRYYIDGHLGPETKEVWIVCHGYGYLAEYFVKYFERLASDTCCVVAPEGLSRFYKDGMGGDVGASWMTKSDRLSEIDDYVAYLDQLTNLVMKDLDRTRVKLNVLGFSQGTAAVCRWLTMGSTSIDNLVVWAGEIPGDINFNKFNEVLNGKPVHLVIGDSDEFVSSKMLEQFEMYLKSKSIDYILHLYQGGHKIDGPLLLEIAEKFREA